MESGIIIRSLSGFYTVYLNESKRTATCKARGRFRHTNITPCVGDYVDVLMVDENNGRLENINDRKNMFERPLVANVGQMIIVASCAIPETDMLLLDRMICICEVKNVEPIIIINKTDLVSGAKISDIYNETGIRVIECSAQTGKGIKDIRDLLKGKVSAFTGNSGVGKSSIINALYPNMNLKTGEISEKLGRGRHTTRQVELFEVDDSTFIIDTPGFSAFDEITENIQSNEIDQGFREFRPYLGKCRFVGCAHIKDSGCAVIDAVENGLISKSRYDNYKAIYTTTKEKEIPWKVKK